MLRPAHLALFLSLVLGAMMHATAEDGDLTSAERKAALDALNPDRKPSIAVGADKLDQLGLQPCGSKSSRNWALAEAVRRYGALEAPLDNDDRPVDVEGFEEAANAPGDRSVRPFRVIEPLFPARAMAEGLEGYCNAVFDVSSTGRAFNIAVACTLDTFEPAVRGAMTRDGIFLPARSGGVAMVRRRVSQPFAFCLAQ